MSIWRTGGAKTRLPLRLLRAAARSCFVAALVAPPTWAAEPSSSDACVVPLGGAATGNVITMHALPGGGVLIGAERGLLRVDPAWRAVVTVGDA